MDAENEQRATGENGYILLLLPLRYETQVVELQLMVVTGFKCNYEEEQQAPPLLSMAMELRREKR